jgi:hypothetical protein
MAKVKPKEEIYINGIWYRAGDELPEEKKEKKSKKEVENG